MLSVAAVVVAIWGGYRLLTAGKQTTDDAQVQADVVGLAPRVSGLVAQVFIRENQQVRAGDRILQLDPAEYLARLHEAEANRDSAQAQADAADLQAQVAEAAARGTFTSAEAQVASSAALAHSSDADIAAARAGVARAAADFRRATLEHDRARALLAQHAITQQQVDAIEEAFLAARAGVSESRARERAARAAQHAARGRVGEAQGHLGASRPVDEQIRVAQANAKLARARAEAAAAQATLAALALDYTTVRAPQDGVVSNLTVHPGQLLQASQVFLQLVPSRMYVVANFKETQTDHMLVGQRVVVDVDAYPGRDIEGWVESLSGATGARFSLLPPENASGNFVKIVQRVPVRIAWRTTPRDMPPLRAGLSVTVKVYENERGDTSITDSREPKATVGRRP